MPARVQGLRFGLGSAKQADIPTASTTFNRFRKLNMDVPFLLANTETDKDEIGKGHEFISANGVFLTNKDSSGRIEKFGSAEFMLWAWAYALGDVDLSTSLYTINPIDPGTTLELPYWSLVAQLDEGGDTAIDETHLGMSIASVETQFHYGPGRDSVKTTVNYVGSGRATIPSGVVLSDTVAEFFTKSSSMAITVNGTDYVAGSPGAKTMLMGTIGWNNNPILPMRYFPGSGLDGDGFAVGGRTFIGNRVPTFTFTAFLTKDSDELAKLIAQTTGTAAITFTYDATHYITFTFHSVSFELVEKTQEEGLVCVQVTVAAKSHATDGVLTVTGKCGLTDIAQ